MAKHTLDTSGLRCPMPILKAKMALRSLHSGEQLHIITTDPASMADFKIFAAQTGHVLLQSSQQADGQFSFVIQKK